MEWLLLFLRTAAILAAVVAWARPAPPAEQALLAKTQGRLVLLIDRSLSMRAVVGGRSRFAEAQDAARKLIENSPRGTMYTIIAFDEQAELLCENEPDAARAVEIVTTIQAGTGGTSTGGALVLARASILGSGGAARVALLSDMQKSSLREVAPGLFQDLSVQWIFEPRLMAPAPPNSGIGEIQSNIFDGMLTLDIQPSGSRDVSVRSRKWKISWNDGEREWPASDRILSAGAVRESDTIPLSIELTGSDCLEEDDRARITVASPRRIPVLIRATPEALPYLSAAVRAINGVEVSDPRGAVLLGDGAAGEEDLAAPGLIGALLFQAGRPEVVAETAGSWRISAGTLDVDGISAVRVRRRSNLAGSGNALLVFDDGKPAAVENKSPAGLRVLHFAFGADLGSADAVLSTSFPILLRKSLNALGIGQDGRILSREPEFKPAESDLECASLDELAEKIGPGGEAGRTSVSASNVNDPAQWSSAALACAFGLLLGETLLARRKP